MSDARHLTATVRERAARAAINGMGISKVALSYGVDRKTISRWVSKYSEGGGTALRRKSGSGRPRKREELTEEELSKVVLQGAIAFGFETNLWTASRLCRAVQDEFRIQLSRNTMSRRLREAGLTYQEPVRAYFEIDEATRKKWIRDEVPTIQRRIQKHRAILYFQYESHISLAAFLGKTGPSSCQTPKLYLNGKRTGVSATSAISHRGRLLFRSLDNRIFSNKVIEFLDLLLRHHPSRHLVVVMGQAPPNSSKKTKAWIACHPRLHVFYLPKFSPDWTPDENFWTRLKHQDLSDNHAKAMTNRPALIRDLFVSCCVAELFKL